SCWPGQKHFKNESICAAPPNASLIRDIPLREGAPISVGRSRKQEGENHFKDPTDWDKTGCIRAGPPHTFKAIKPNLAYICNH
ncbi:hypothetical protein A2U01_0054201, partial [Trifolium medium]|nr:hypothetical protein [Trifolium medium]